MIRTDRIINQKRNANPAKARKNPEKKAMPFLLTNIIGTIM